MVEDARFVIKEIGSDYPQIRASQLVKQFKVEGFPSVIRLDSKRNLRDVHIGYVPDLRQTISRRIDVLLAESAVHTQ